MNPFERLEAARTGADVLAALAAGIDAEADAPTPEALADWWPVCPDPARAEADARLRSLALAGSADPERPVGFDGDPEAIRFEGCRAWWPVQVAYVGRSGRATAVSWRLVRIGPLDLSRLWLEVRNADPEGCPPHPLAPIVRAWIERPPQTRAETRPDPIPPVVRVREAPEREAGRLAFGGLVSAEHADAQLPLLPAPDGPRVALLELVDVSGVRTMARGRGAPLPLRLAVAVALGVPLANRGGRVELVTTVRELRDFLLPNGWERARHWPAIRAALWRLNSFAVPTDDRGGLWLPFRPWTIPGPGAALDDRIRLEVRLPPGSASGPIIDRRELARLGVQSAPRFRAYIAAHSVAWIPGKTRIPHPRNRAFRLWAGDADKYPILTAEDRDRLAFGDGWANRRRKEGRRKADSHWERLPGSAILSRKASTMDGRRGWLIVPEEAASAIRKPGGRQPGEDRATTGGR